MKMFFIVMLTIYLSGYVYIAWRITSGLNMHSYRAAVYFIFIALFVLSVLAFIFARSQSPLSPVIVPIGLTSMGIWGIFITFFILADIANLLNLALHVKNFRLYSAYAALSLSLAVCVWSLLNSAFILRTKNITVPVANLPVSELKIVQLSDIHIHSATSPKTVNAIFGKVMKLNPDIILITGDVSDMPLNENGKFEEYGFDKLHAPYGVFAVTGNHEYYAGLNAFLEIFAKLGFRVLQNENVLIDNLINAAGINDIDHKNRQVIEKVLSASDKNYPVLFLSHQPESFDIAAEYGKDLNIIQFSGHTHAGQVPPIDIARRFFMKYNYGLYKIGEKAVLYVTSGTRYWGPPMRFITPSEITVITLKNS
ncbi:MAG: metallophosphoesterase [Endomicrobium sp.]|nr:metallophosphoesterase [Endomicrobium sp.]